MSLVNQMLRDLEKRRAAERHGAGAIFHGLTSSEEGRRARWPLLTVGVVAIALAGAVGYLLLERRAAPVAEPATPVVAPVATLPAEVVMPPAAAEPPSTTVAINEPVPLAPEPQRTLPRRERAAQPSVTTPPVVVAPVTPPSAESSAPVEMDKRPLPPTPQQQAAIAYQQGYEALRANRPDEAERRWREALDFDPTHVAARENLAATLLRAGRQVEAGELLDAGMKALPNVTSFRKLHARLRMEQADLPGAIAALEAGAESAARDSEYQALMGALYQRQGNFAQSVQRYQQALSLEPRQGIWWLGLAISAERAGQDKDAVAAYRRALETGIEAKLAAYARERLKALPPVE